MNQSRKISPHKGGRTERVYLRATPAIKRAAELLAKSQNISVADLFENLIQQAIERTDNEITNSRVVSYIESQK